MSIAKWRMCLPNSSMWLARLWLVSDLNYFAFSKYAALESPSFSLHPPLCHLEVSVAKSWAWKAKLQSNESARAWVHVCVRESLGGSCKRRAHFNDPIMVINILPSRLCCWKKDKLCSNRGRCDARKFEQSLESIEGPWSMGSISR